MIDLSVSYLGLELKSPLIAASSGITSGIKNLTELEKRGVGAVVLKSLFEEEIVSEMKRKFQTMNMQGFVYPETLDFYEKSDSGEEETAIKYLELIREAKKTLQIPVIASINCVTSGQWTYFPREIQNAGADALELNLFILPTDVKRTALENESIYFSIIEEVKKQVTMPIAVKTSFYFSNLLQMLTRISESGVNGLVLFNRFYAPDIDIDSLELTNGNVLSHSEDLSLTLRWIALISGRISCDLAATTGIHTGRDLAKVLLAGADVAEIASVLYQHGLGSVDTILGDFTNWMNTKGFSSLRDFKGMLSQENVSNPAAYERVQFMKHFRGYKSNSIY
ncbi:MAG: dihydroorotate dehydrogenase-like protein [Bacteroidales bacterium]|nr:dihydroorotate dehydrogenase-like protein [Bacteroidales bacterium]